MSRKKYHFAYVRVDDHCKRPYIPVTFKNNQKEITHLMLIDSGADTNILPIELAGILDIDVNRLEKHEITGIGGQRVIGHKTILKLQIRETEFDALVIFANIGKDAFGIVGQMGFFDHFKITFDHMSNKIYLTQKKR